MLRRIGLGFFVLLIALSLVFGGRYLWQNNAVKQAVVHEAAKGLGVATSASNVIPTLLGFDRPRTYLVLFLNNTELRPGGGFIGSYAEVQINKGIAHIIKFGATEHIENVTNTMSTLAQPPAALAKYLKVTEWYFRDSNWSPDFVRSSQAALTLYAREHAPPASGFDGVIAVTPTVIEQLLKITGPITVRDLQLTSDNVTEKTEYEVEYGYKQRGIAFDERKVFLEEFGKALIATIKGDVWKHWSSYVVLMQKMIAEKQVAVYAVDARDEALVQSAGWSGEVRTAPGDYLLWVDANLGALKTDVAITRELSYSLTPTSSGYVAEATMRYQHTGHFDWRTTRYRDYARVFVPRGSAFIFVSGAMTNDREQKPGVADQGVEGEKQWFGAFIAVEPGQTGTLTFRYLVSPTVAEQIRSGSYSLMVDKQLGTGAVPLTVGLDFGTKVMSASPSELPEKHNDTRYDVKTDLRVNREFKVTLQH